MKYCRDCVHYQTWHPFLGLLPSCKRFPYLIRDPVQGEYERPQSCERARRDDGPCGLAADYFTPRPPSLIQRLKSLFGGDR